MREVAYKNNIINYYPNQAKEIGKLRLIRIKLYYNVYLP